MKAGVCGICKRPLAAKSDPMSADCGGDCWGCIGWLEYMMEKDFDPEDRLATPEVQREIRAGLREADGQAK